MPSMINGMDSSKILRKMVFTFSSETGIEKDSLLGSSRIKQYSKRKRAIC